MSTQIIHSLANFPEGYCWPADPQTYGDDLIALLTSVLAGESVGIIMGKDLPAPEDQDKVWVRLDATGYLEGIYTFKGVWHRPHPVPPSSYQRIIWTGSKEDLWAFDGGSGENPASVTPGGSDGTVGAMWEVDASFEFRIPMGAGTNPTTYDDASATVLNVGDSAGAEKIEITKEQLSHTHAIGRMKTDSGDNANDGYFFSQDDPTAQLTGMSRGVNGPGDGYHESDISNLSGQYLKTGSLELDENSPKTPAISVLPPVKGVLIARRTARRFLTVTS